MVCTAGSGGAGAIEFSKIKMNLGPAGGSGGAGASIYLEGISDIGALASYASRKMIRAADGKPGRGRMTDGRDGKDLVLRVPVGTRVITETTDDVREVTRVGERLLVARGGAGGRGNYLFRSSTRTTPKIAENGKPGEVVTLRLELRLIANVGLVGLPNAGKSSLLNELTAARSKVGNYPFTTLEPSLGSYYGLIIADIPGLIEGASSGKGLGVKFLKHIERTKIIFHLVSAETADVVGDYQIVRRELAQYNPALLEKAEYVLLSHADMVSAKELPAKLKQLRQVNPNVMSVSVIDDTMMAAVKQVLNEIKVSEGIVE